jgi:glycine/D-amino acid oxidase-like deaminating enzyme
MPRSLVPSYPRHRGHLEADVVIVGGGATGCATAQAFAAQGIKVVLIEGDRLGRGSSGSSQGWLADDPGVAFLALEQALGRRAARQAWQGWRRASREAAALLRRLSVKCQLQPTPALLVATTTDQAEGLRRERKARAGAGLDAPMPTAAAVGRETGMGVAAALRTRDGAVLDPYRATIGLAAAAVKRGARVFERTVAERIVFRPKWVDIRTAGGTLRADRVVVATGQPTALFKSLVRHVSLRTGFLALTEPVPARLRRVLGQRSSVIRDLASPPHAIRWVDGDRLLVAGADSDRVPERLREKVVVQRTGQLMYELSLLYPEISGLMPAFGWSADYARTADGLPYIGPHRNYPRHLFAFGDAGHGLTGAFLASRILLRHHLDEAEPADGVFGFTR